MVSERGTGSREQITLGLDAAELRRLDGNRVIR